MEWERSSEVRCKFESWTVLERIELWGSESSDRTRRREDWREEMEDLRVERESSALFREDN